MRSMVFAILLFLACAGSPSPGEVGKQLMLDLEAGNVTAVYDAMSEADQQRIDKIGGKAALARDGERFKEMGGIKTIEVASEEIHGETAKVSLKVTYGNGTPDTLELNFVKENGEWRSYKG